MQCSHWAWGELEESHSIAGAVGCYAPDVSNTLLVGKEEAPSRKTCHRKKAKGHHVYYHIVSYSHINKKSFDLEYMSLPGCKTPSKTPPLQLCAAETLPPSFLYLLDKFARPSAEDLCSRRANPLLRHAHAAASPATDPAHHRGVRLGIRFLDLLIGGSILGSLGGGDASSALGGLLAQQSVDGIHLERWLVRARGVMSLTRFDWAQGSHTFSSSFRFSLRFFRRRAISARRIARSSAVRCFFTWGSAYGQSWPDEQ